MFESMDVKEKVMLAGGAILVLIFFVRGIKSSSSQNAANTAPAVTATANTQPDPVAQALGQMGASLQQENQAFNQAITDQGNLFAQALAANQKTTSDQMTAITQAMTSNQKTTSDQMTAITSAITSSQTSIANLLSQMRSSLQPPPAAVTPAPVVTTPTTPSPITPAPVTPPAPSVPVVPAPSAPSSSYQGIVGATATSLPASDGMPGQSGAPVYPIFTNPLHVDFSWLTNPNKDPMTTAAYQSNIARNGYLVPTASQIQQALNNKGA